jgi:2-amino-4-hydroxy-6-hydroxymethyldihydropteridine diphosphokinase
MAGTSYLIAIGANRAGAWGSPRRAVLEALRRLEPARVSQTIETAPVGPSLRRYVNAVALVESGLEPPALLDWLKAMERAAGRRPGQRWGARPLDLDIILWSDGPFASDELTVPHPQYRERRFVLVPLAEVAPDWRDPLTGLSVRQALARLTARERRPTSRAG